MEKALPRALIIGISAIQGLLLLAVYMAFKQKVWPYDDAVSLTTLLTLFISLPLMAMLAAETGRLRGLSKWLGLFGLCLLLVAAYTGYQLVPVDKVKPGPVLLAFSATISIACFKALMYIQQRSNRAPISYSVLFMLSWRNFIILGLAVIFCALFWGILMLLAGLFESIEIKFFTEMFTQTWFYFPALSIAGGVAITIFRNMTPIIDVIAKLLQALIKYLLPLVILVAMLFLIALLIGGLELLWKTGAGTVMVLWLLAIVLFFINTVYQDKSDVIPYPSAVHRFVYLGFAAVMPIYVLIACYGLYLRIAQYGWSIARCWGVLVCGLLAIFIFGYVWGIIKRRDEWIGTLSRVNIVMSIIILAVTLLLNSPLLDFRKIVTHSQMARLNAGQISLDAMDIEYFADYLARPGYLAMQDLKQEFARSHPEFVSRIDVLYTRKYVEPEDIDTAQLTAMITVSPVNAEVPVTLLDALTKKVNADKYYLTAGRQYYLFEMNLDDDPAFEYIWLEVHINSVSAMLWHLTDAGWDNIYMSRTGHWSRERLKQWVGEGNYSVVPPRWQRFKIGDMIFSADGQ